MERVSYRERASFYQYEYTDTVDHAFLYGLIRESTRAILEVPSGVGRNVLNMARSGCPIVAVDREPEMVRVLRERVREHRPASPVDAVVGDLCTLDLGRVFDLIVVPREAFQLLAGRQQAAQALERLRLHLAPQGELVIDLSPFGLSPGAGADLRPDYFDPGLADGVWTRDWTRPILGRDVTRHHLQRHLDDNTLEVLFRYEAADGANASQQTETSTSFRIYSCEDFAGLAQDAGLAVTACHGNYEKKPFEPGDPRMIFRLALPQRPGLAADAAVAPGRSQGFSDGFSNEVDARRIDDFARVPRRPQVREYFEAYARNYFSGPFVAGSGAEEILQVMAEFGGRGRALDLGAGTSSPFWYMPATGVQSVSCCDVAPEALEVLNEFIRGDEEPQCYRWVAEAHGLGPRRLQELRRRFGEYLVFDCLRRWPSWLDRAEYQLITAFGTLSLCGDAAEYRAAFGEIARHLAAGGRTIGADWLRRSRHNGAGRHDNSYLHAGLLRDAMAGAGIEVRKCVSVGLGNDPYYQSIILWAGTK